MTKVEVIEVEATRLDPDAVYLIVFNVSLMSIEYMRNVSQQLSKNNIKHIGTYSVDPERTLKVYQIPKEQK